MADSLGKNVVSPNAVSALIAAARDEAPVAGFTHKHYKYPARFSPAFVTAAINEFSSPGDVVLDPHVGGGTTLVEAMAHGRTAIGCDVNSLATFVSKVKTSILSETELFEVEQWAQTVLTGLSYQNIQEATTSDPRTRNMEIPRARAIKKIVSLGLESLDAIEPQASKDLVRCILLSAGQWALNGRKHSVNASQFRAKAGEFATEMVRSSRAFSLTMGSHSTSSRTPIIVQDAAENLANHEPFKSGLAADLVVTSPPYPGVHVLYHRWQVDGRKESPAPYWIANCLDGHGAKYYNYGGRSISGIDSYFETALRSLQGIRSVMKPGAVIVQLIAFSVVDHQLPRYLEVMKAAGFSEVLDTQLHALAWRDVPGRRWHANSKGKTQSSKELVLIHVAN